MNSPSVSFSASVTERIAQAKAILSLMALCDSETVSEHMIDTALAASSDIINDVVTQIAFPASSSLGHDVAGVVNDKLMKAQGVISLLVHYQGGTDDFSETFDIVDTLELTTSAAIQFLCEAIEALASGASA